MKKTLVVLTLLVFGFFTQAYATEKIAVVDVAQVVASSSQVKATKLELEAKLKEVEAWLITAKADVNKQSTIENKEKMIKKYDTEFVKKQANLREEYGKKLKAIDDSINNAITKVAKSKGYTMVLSKNTVLMGGDDITADVIKSVK